MIARKKSLIIATGVVIALIASMNSTMVVSAHPPQNLVLEYDFAAQELSAEITHIVVNLNFHYTASVRITKNGSLFAVYNYTSQPTTSVFKYVYDVPAIAGDVLDVELFCSLFGSRAASLIVNESQQSYGEIEIGTVKSGIFSIQAEIKNIAAEVSEDVEWEISVKGGIFGLLNRTRMGTIATIEPGSSRTVRSGPIIALGDVLVTVRAGPREDLTVERNVKGKGRFLGVTLQQPLKVGFQLIAEGFTSPVDLVVPEDGTNRQFVVDQIGKISVIDNGTLLPEPFLNISDKMVPLMGGFDERGLLGLAFHPDYETNGKFYIFYSAPADNLSFNCTSTISQYQVSAENENLADPNSEQIILTIDKPEFNHNAGRILFGPDGHLYIAVGDGGGANDAHGLIGNGQNLSTLLGKMLRIDVDSAFPYAIPPDNPYVGQEGLDEIFAIGFRNPWRFSYDAPSNRFYVADVGQNKYEELNIMELGKNYGWRIMEGFHEFDPDLAVELGINIEDLAAPIDEYSHGMGLSVIGGYVYHGDAFPELQNKYVYGDWSDGFIPGKARLFYLEETEEFGFTRYEFSTDVNNTIQYLLAFGQDINGELYVLTSENLGPTGATGQVSRIIIKAS
jgi:glucose/arabinose dehydrogenase